jgi:hypothetical protein
VSCIASIVDVSFVMANTSDLESGQPQPEVLEQNKEPPQPVRSSLEGAPGVVPDTALGSNEVGQSHEAAAGNDDNSPSSDGASDGPSAIERLTEAEWYKFQYSQERYLRRLRSSPDEFTEEILEFYTKRTGLIQNVLSRRTWTNPTGFAIFSRHGLRELGLRELKYFAELATAFPNGKQGLQQPYPTSMIFATVNEGEQLVCMVPLLASFLDVPNSLAATLVRIFDDVEYTTLPNNLLALGLEDGVMVISRQSYLGAQSGGSDGHYGKPEG